MNTLMRLMMMGALSKGVGLPPPPAGYGYLFIVDNNGVNQLVTITDANGVTRPIYVLGGS